MDLACNTCKKTSPEVTLKKCAKCSTTPYCSRDCQKTDWKTHKKVCGKQASEAAAASASAAESAPRRTTTDTDAANARSPPKGLEKAITKPFTRLDNGTWLHERSEVDVYRLLIDTYRMRMEDNYNLEGEADEDSVYGGAPDSLLGFRRFFKLAASRKDLLPGWWSPEKQKECEALGMKPSQWYDLRATVEKSDVIEHYGDSKFPMQLRMFGESVYLRGPGGQEGRGMRQMMAMMEGGMPRGMHATMMGL